MTVLDALFGGGDTAAAAIAADRLRSLATRSFDEMPGAPCVSELWRTSRGRFETTRQVITRLRAVTLPKDREATARDRRFMEISRVCTTVLEALLATHEARADAPEALARLDSVMRAGPVSAYELTSAGNLTAARLFEQRGDLEAALDAVRRRVHHFGTYESTHLREEGRLAALLGDREEAIAAYERYLTLRSDPEPSVAPEVEAVRQALARLIAEPGSGR
jgi:tetratricopeptide (TPR) repeat protein